MNNKLSGLQIEGIEKWKGDDVLIINPNGSYGNCSFEYKEKVKWESTEYFCATKILDDLKVPLIDESNGKKYSIVGRILWLSRNGR